MKPEPVRRSPLLVWLPAVVLLVGLAGLQSAKRQVDMPLVRPLSETLPDSLVGLAGIDRVIEPEELKVSGVSQYAFRVFGGDSGMTRLSLYVGYYEAQSRGKTIHSPKNCLPGAGWEPVESSELPVDVGSYRFTVNRYVLENRGRRALVYYWYQGRSRIASNEYKVKWEQIRDRAIAGRSDEALVRIVVPVTPAIDINAADSIAVQVTRDIVMPIFASLPPFPRRSVPGLDVETVGRANPVTGGLLPRKS